jgi:predicted transcriptional regulator
MVRISVEVSDEVAEALTRLAQHRGSTAAALLSRWAAQAVDDRRDLERRAEEALADLKAGRTIDHDEVMEELEAWARDVEARHRNTP